MLTRAPRFLGACVATALVAAGTILATGSPAHALALEQVCTGTWTVTYDPPITDTLQTVSAVLSANFPHCTDPEAPSASYSQAFTDTVSCATLLNTGSAAHTFVWGNPAAQPSTFTYSWTVSDLAGQAVITSTGQITSGKYMPDNAEQISVLVTPNPIQCAFSGVATLTGPTTLTILHAA
jgi:hypothetical protein